MNTAQAAKKLSLTLTTLRNYLYTGRIARPAGRVMTGKRGRPSFDWTADDIKLALTALKEPRHAEKPDAKRNRGPHKSAHRKASAPAPEAPEAGTPQPVPPAAE